MAVPRLLNKNNSAVKRIMQEARELANDPSTDYSAAPLEDDIFEWHCTLRGPSGTDFEGGLYHFRIQLPAEYPFRPPSIMLLTPNGRFELNTKICISFTNYHEELWQPAWGVRTAIIGLQGFFPLKGQAAVGVGALEVPSSERKRLAALSRDWVCPRCNRSNLECLPDPPQSNDSESASEVTSSSEGEIVPTPPPVMSPQSVESETPVPTREADQDGDDGADRSESDDTIFVVASSSTGASTPQQLNGPVVHGTRPASAAPFRPSHSPTSVRPPMLLDTAICVLLVLVFALLCRRVL
ncbi:non-canonical ubiquitin conjugating enzyme 1 [Russula earlei]|uniref:Non-canonical ubiquitin conjugating enzyme 1 n=1 Tax=Russula earlei TaxID=71964 RepID=A0ACC0UAC2_9AGAM|nr:non-canonical ubiquitin conjugating enzyme 1 [Russula earlei]